MKRRLTSGLLVCLLVLTAVAEALPQAPRLPTGSSLTSEPQSPGLLSLPPDRQGRATLVGGSRASRQLARFAAAECEEPVPYVVAHAVDPDAHAPPFHRKRPLPRSTGDDSDSH